MTLDHCVDLSTPISNAMDSKQITVEMYHQHHGPPTRVNIVFVAMAINQVIKAMQKRGTTDP